jgi:hypothetical protein
MMIVKSTWALRSVQDSSSSARWQRDAQSANGAGPWYLALISGET